VVFSRYSTNKTDRYDITEILLKVALNTINQTMKFVIFRFNKDRIDTLGPELGPAHFIVARNGAVKFKDRKNWIRIDASGSFAVPRHKVDSLYLEGIDASNTKLMYEGLENLSM
jgi:hypothetical protein